jgi:4,5-dihydroxyphthalate decarboxylase
VKLGLAIRPYDGVLPLLRGEVRIPGVELQAREMLGVGMFAEFFRGEHDVSEMSLAESVYYVSRGKVDFTCLPIFPSRYFRHGYWFCNVASGIDAPHALKGKRIGFQRWVQTAGVWMRGQLREHYGLSPADNEWYVASVHHWDEGHETLEPRDGSILKQLGAGATPENAHSFLMDGKVDLMGTTEIHLSKMRADPRVKRLFPDFRRVEDHYYRQTGIFPIMHLVGMRGALAEQRPELPAQVFQAFAEAKALSRRHASALPSHMLAWRPAYLEEEAEIFGADPWQHGLDANRAVLEKFISYCYDQGIAARRIKPEELFHPTTWALEEGT